MPFFWKYLRQILRLDSVKHYVTSDIRDDSPGGACCTSEIQNKSEFSSYRVNCHWLAARRELTQVRSNEDDNERLRCERQ
jgi:hypothetical protein